MMKKVLLAVLVTASGCSFGTAASRGSNHVSGGKPLTDIIIGGGLVLGGIVLSGTPQGTNQTSADYQSQQTAGVVAFLAAGVMFASSMYGLACSDEGPPPPPPEPPHCGDVGFNWTLHGMPSYGNCTAAEIYGSHTATCITEGEMYVCIANGNLRSCDIECAPVQAGVR